MSLEGKNFSSLESYVFGMLYSQEGILSIAAAGNDGSTAYGYPASYNSVISVGAVDQSSVVAGFSQHNDQVELAAPGVGIRSTSKDGGDIYMNGTSMATPHVAAAAALVWSSDPSKTNAEIRQVFQSSALDLGAPGRDNDYGYGEIQSLAAYESLNGSPTAVQVTAFEAFASAHGIQIEWATASEIDILGFNIVRADTLAGRETLVNGALIASKSAGSPTGAAYTLLDDTVTAGISYYYWLDAVDTQGGSSRQGPVSTTASSPSIYRAFVPMVFR